MLIIIYNYREKKYKFSELFLPGGYQRAISLLKNRKKKKG